MKRFLIVAAILFGFSFARASESVWLSSTTATTDKDKVLCGGRGRGLLYKVLISSGGGGTSAMVSVFNSSFTTVGVSQVGPINAANTGSFEYRSTFQNGMLYTSTGTAVMTILYQCY